MLNAKKKSLASKPKFEAARKRRAQAAGTNAAPASSTSTANRSQAISTQPTDFEYCGHPAGPRLSRAAADSFERFKRSCEFLGCARDESLRRTRSGTRHSKCSGGGTTENCWSAPSECRRWT